MLFITDGLPRGLGYLEIDHRAGGNAPVGLPTHFEADTYTCTHCSRVVVLNPARVRERYKCKGCNHHICDDCAAQRIAGGECLTMQEKYERHLESLQKPQVEGFLGFNMETGNPVIEQKKNEAKHAKFLGYDKAKNRAWFPDETNSGVSLDNSGHLASTQP